MGLKSDIEFKAPGVSVAEFLAAYPPLPARVRAMDSIVRNFPRRLFKWVSPRRQEKIVSHALCFAKPLTQSDRIDPDQRFQFRRADESLIEQMVSHEEAFPANFYYRRLKRGDACFCLCQDGKLLSYQWVNFKTCSVYCGAESEIHFQNLSENDCYLYDFYTYEEYRGQGIGTTLKKHVWSALYDQGMRSCCNAIHHDNFVSLRIHLRGGFELTGLVYVYRLMAMNGALWGTRSELAAVQKWLDSIDAVH